MKNHTASRPPALASFSYAAVSNRHGPDAIDAMIDMIIDTLTRDRDSGATCFLDSIFDRAQSGHEPNDTHPDVLLTELWGFHEDRLPKLDNLFSSEVGRFTDTVVCALFDMTCAELTDRRSETFNKLCARLGEIKLDKDRTPKAEKWKNPDFVYGSDTIVEVKYRFNSYDGKAKQIAAGRYYRALGYTPVFLHLSPDFRSREAFEKEGWIVHTGQDALDYIRFETGVDFTALIRAVRANPIIAARMAEGHEALRQRLGYQMCYAFDNADEQTRHEFCLHVASDKENAITIAKMAGLDTLADRAEAAYLAKVDDIDMADPKTFNFAHIRSEFADLDQEQQQEFLEDLQAIAKDTSGLAPLFTSCRKTLTEPGS